MTRTVTPDTIVRMDDSFNLTLREFFDANGEAYSPEERQQIIEELRDQGVHRGGGGAMAQYELALAPDQEPREQEAGQTKTSPGRSPR